MSVKKRLTILLDMDGVIADMIGLFCKQYNALPGVKKKISEADIKGWNVEKYLEKKYNWSFDSMLRYPLFFFKIKPYDGAIELTKFLIKRHDVIFCSAPYDARCCMDKFLWLEREFGKDFHKRMLTLTHRKEMIPGDIIIDDKLETIRTSMAKHRILIDRPWNQERTEIGFTYAAAVSYINRCLS